MQAGLCSENLKGCKKGNSGENMASNTNQEARKVADRFVGWAVDQCHDFKEFLILYNNSEKRRELLEETAKEFFNDLFRMYIDRIIQNVSSLTDPPETGGNLNFSIRSIHNYFKCHPGYDTKNAEKLIKNIELEAKKVRAWRNKLTDHYDWDVAKGDKKVEDRFLPGNFKILYDNLWRYVKLLLSSVFEDVFDYSEMSSAIELVKALKEACALRDLKKHDKNAYHNLISNSAFKDA
jgi:hypothetical protein